MTEQQKKETYMLRMLLDSDNRRFIYNEEIHMSFEKRFQMVLPDARLLQFARGDVGMTSDCFIMYAIARLGCPTKEAILNFLNTLALQSPDLHIVTDKALLEERLRALCRVGVCMRYVYSVKVGKEQTVDKVAMYILTEDGVSMVRQRLKKHCVINAAFYAKHDSDLIGWSSAASAGALMANTNKGFVEFCEPVLRTKQMGSMFFSCEWKSLVDGVYYYVTFMPSYLDFDTSYMTQRDYDEVCATTINMIRNYLNCRTQKGIPCVVISVRDNKDLNNIALNIVASGVMEGMLGNIYFTGEGIYTSLENNLKKSFLRICMDSSEKAGYAICATQAPFLA